jgi:hypothetical protein
MTDRPPAPESAPQPLTAPRRKLSRSQEALLRVIGKSKVRYFPAKWSSGGFFEVGGNKLGKEYRVSTLESLIRLGFLRCVKRFPTDATEGPSTGGFRGQVLIRNWSGAASPPEEGR